MDSFETRDRIGYHRSMTALLEQAIEWVRALPPETQDEFARVLLQLSGVEQPIYQLTAEDESSLEISRGQAARREYATDAQMHSIWAKYGL